MQRLTLTTTAVVLAATGAFASNHENGDAEMNAETAQATETANSGADMMNDGLIRTRDITGGYVYTTDAADDEGWDATRTYETVDAGWKQVGEIEDLVLSKDGKLTAIVAEVGGVLDLGDKHVVLEIKDLNLVATDDRTYAYVTHLNEEDLEEMEGVDEGFWN